MAMQDGVPFPVWTVHRENGERHDGPITEICATKELADSVARDTGWYNGDAPVRPSHAIAFDGMAYLLADKEPIAIAYNLDGVKLSQQMILRKKALAKLSKEEREALGLR